MKTLNRDREKAFRQAHPYAYRKLFLFLKCAVRANRKGLKRNRVEYWLNAAMKHQNKAYKLAPTGWHFGDLFDTT